MRKGHGNCDNSPSEKTPILGTKKKRCWPDLPTRYGFALNGFSGIFFVYAMRVNLSVAMVAMVRQTIQKDASTVACRELLPVTNNSTSVHITTEGEFDWGVAIQGLLHGAFFGGYILTQIPGGILAEKYSAKWLFGIGVLVTAFFTLMTPIAARWGGAKAVLAVRFMEGLGEGVTFPAMHVLIGRWVPKGERSRIATLIHSGAPLGTVVSLSVSGFLSDSNFLGGWPSVFYVFGGLSCIWFVFWMVFVYDSPDQHPSITKEELFHIHEGLENVPSQHGPTPWRSILTSSPLWALAITHFGYSWGFYTLLTELPTYLSNVLHFELKKNGVLSALPYLLQAVFAYIASFVADKMRVSNRFRITTIRKIMNSIAFYGAGIIVLCIAFTGCNPTIIVVLLTICVGFSGFVYSGFNITHVDMSPAYAGTLMGITNCIANFSGFLAPAYVGWAVQDGQTLRNWGIVFITASAVYFLAGSIYNIFGSAELQPWGTATQPTSQESPNSKAPDAETSTRSSEP